MKRIAISSGHYPERRGAYFEGLAEHELANEWVDILFDTFDDLYDFDVSPPEFDLVPVPTGTLREKVAFVNSNYFDFAIELHFNSAHRKASGSETLFMPNSQRGYEFATIVQEHIAPALQIRDRGVKEGFFWSTRERTNTPLYFLRRTNCPAIIIEPEFLQSYRQTMDHETIKNFCFALIEALNTISIEEI